MTMRPKFNANTAFIPVSDGTYLRSNRASLKFKGKNLATILELLIPSLNGHSTLEEIVQGLSTEKKMLVMKLLETLLSFDFLRDTSLDQPHTLTQAELATYAANIAFIDSFQNSAASRFASFRNKRLLVIGAGHSFTALVQACLHSGVRQMSIIRTSECGLVAAPQSDLLDLFPPDDPAQSIQAIGAPRWDDEADVLNTIHAYDALLHISDRPMLARAQLLNRLCMKQKKTCMQAIVVDDHAWIGPLISAETGGCWECAWRRLQANTTACVEHPPSIAFRDHITASLSQFFAPSTAAMIAGRLIFEVFKHFTQAGQEEERAGSLIDMHLETFLYERHTFLPHPHCHACQHPGVPTATQFLGQIQQLQRQDPLDPAALCENMVHYVDDRLGLFTAFDADDFVQVPLAVYKVGLSNPMLLNYPVQVTGVGIERNSARVRACQRACERYAASFVDQRRLLSREAIQQQVSSVIPVDQLLEAPACLTNVETWTWTLDLHTSQVCLIPAPLAFPSLLHSVPGVGDERGIGSGMSWAEAICQAVFDWCTFLAIEEVRSARQRYARVDLARVSMTAEGAYLHRILQTVGEQVSVYDVTGALQIPTFATCMGESVVAYSTHCDVAQALSMGFRQAMQQQQSMQAQQPEYALVPVPDLPLALRDDRCCELAYQIVPEAWPARQEWLLQMLRAHNMHALALPLDHDPALVRMFPSVVRVLLARFM